MQSAWVAKRQRKAEKLRHQLLGSGEGKPSPHHPPPQDIGDLEQQEGRNDDRLPCLQRVAIECFGSVRVGLGKDPLGGYRGIHDDHSTCWLRSSRSSLMISHEGMNSSPPRSRRISSRSRRTSAIAASPCRCCSGVSLGRLPRSV